MIAAIYARKSTEQHTSDEEKSVTRQVEHATAYAARKGWTVDDTHVYVDDNVSGALFGARRPALARLLNALKPRSPFGMLIMSEESRLGRDRVEAEYVLKQIVDSDVRVHYYLEDREARVDDATSSFVESVRLYAAEMEREKARQRGRDVMARKARRGHVTGGRVFGYENVVITGPAGQRDHVERRVVPSEAQVVVRIFQALAAGQGVSRIAKALNDDGVPPPSASWPSAPGRGWSGTGVRHVARRPTYTGEVVYGRRRGRYRGGARGTMMTPSTDWITTRVEALRIVDDLTWRRAQDRLDAALGEYVRMNNGRILGRPKVGEESRDGKYLLSGLTQCGLCAGAMHVGRRPLSDGTWSLAYVCSRHRSGGDKVCANALRAPLVEYHAAVVDGLLRDVLDEGIVREVVDRVVALRQDDPRDRRGDFTTELRRLEGELRRYAEAIGISGPVPAILDAIQARERRRQDIIARLAKGRPRVTPTHELRALIAKRLDDWRGLIGRHPEQARQTVIRPLLGSRVVLTPEGRAYRFEAPIAWGGLVAGLLDGLGTARSLTECSPRVSSRRHGAAGYRSA